MLEYERFKQAADDLNNLERLERDVVAAEAQVLERRVVTKLPDVTINELLLALKEALDRSDMFAHIHIQREPLSVRERMSNILIFLKDGGYQGFSSLFDTTGPIHIRVANAESRETQS